jgi:glycerol-3-phosphate dehydrogenase (NAD(P)+)
MKIAVLGAGAWGTALALSLAGRHAVTLWTWQAAHAAALRSARENTQFLPGFPFPEALDITADFPVAIATAELAIVATPMAGLRSTASALGQQQPALPLLWVCKGIEAGTGLLPHQVVATVHPAARCGALTGPSFAAEVARPARRRDHRFRQRCLCRHDGA